ncbi:hypothetical protein AHEV_200 [Adoxophyes honmai entomopoxvirus 'L']|uniref:Uncharacterized protein n=1 Tax=Adoxophyes honmai entomopoxvirus 'L' TaxID=1293540 RepID=A0A916KP88_9POXV|nr:hypothetical protein AHEV_200 [Adoxophyes honmai entomopoxvirus 'L']CCU55521.1 hypothetical protein AHEV_200 [Adoxophyes honmai entomopoxvirus 'L']
MLLAFTIFSHITLNLVFKYIFINNVVENIYNIYDYTYIYSNYLLVFNIIFDDVLIIFYIIIIEKYIYLYNMFKHFQICILPLPFLVLIFNINNTVLYTNIIIYIVMMLCFMIISDNIHNKIYNTNDSITSINVK